jgi:hypothetical protein
MELNYDDLMLWINNSASVKAQQDFDLVIIGLRRRLIIQYFNFQNFYSINKFDVEN